MIILDTDVLSALMCQEWVQVVAKWLDGQAESSVWTTSITLMELWYGFQSMLPGRRRERMT